MRTRQAIMPRRYSRMGIDGDGSTLNLDFTTMGALDSRFTFTRSTTATYIDSSGYVATMAAAATNDPTKARFDYDPTTLAAKGLLIEGAGISLVLGSNFAGGTTAPTYWSFAFGTGTSAAAASSTLGNLDGSRAWSQTATSQRPMISSTTINVTSGTTYTASMYVESVSGGLLNIDIFVINQNTATLGTATYKNNGVTVSSSAVATVGRIEITASCTVSGTINLRCGIGCSSNATGSLNFSRPQFEVGTSASSFIPTTASQVTRAEDVCNIGTITAFNYSTTNGTLFYSGVITKQNTSAYPIRLGFYKTAGDEKCFGFLTNANTLFFNATGAVAAEVSKTFTLNTAFKAVMSLDASLATAEVIVNINGSTGSSGATALTATNIPTQFTFGQTGYGANFPCGTIAAVKYWPLTKTAAELAVLTA